LAVAVLGGILELSGSDNRIVFGSEPDAAVLTASCTAKTPSFLNISPNKEVAPGVGVTVRLANVAHTCAGIASLREPCVDGADELPPLFFCAWLDSSGSLLQQGEFNRLAPVSAVRRLDVHGDRELGMLVSVTCPTPTMGDYFYQYISEDATTMSLRLSITHYGPSGAANATAVQSATVAGGDMVEFLTAEPPSLPPPMPPSPPAAPPPQSRTCPQEAGWAYVFELESASNSNDLPDSNAEIAAGFTYTNSYYIGNAALDSLIADTGAEASICSGSTASEGCDLTCITVDASQVGESGITAVSAGSGIAASWKSLSTSFKKMLACLAGQCHDSSLSGSPDIFICSADQRSPMDNTFYDGRTDCRATLRMSQSSEMFHFYGCGLSMYRGTNNIGMESCCSGCNTRNVMQIRYKLP